MKIQNFPGGACPQTPLACGGLCPPLIIICLGVTPTHNPPHNKNPRSAPDRMSWQAQKVQLYHNFDKKTTNCIDQAVHNEWTLQCGGDPPTPHFLRLWPGTMNCVHTSSKQGCYMHIKRGSTVSSYMCMFYLICWEGTPLDSQLRRQLSDRMIILYNGVEE